MQSACGRAPLSGSWDGTPGSAFSLRPRWLLRSGKSSPCPRPRLHALTPARDNPRTPAPPARPLPATVGAQSAAAFSPPVRDSPGRCRIPRSQGRTAAPIEAKPGAEPAVKTGTEPETEPGKAPETKPAAGSPTKPPRTARTATLPSRTKLAATSVGGLRPPRAAPTRPSTSTAKQRHLSGRKRNASAVTVLQAHRARENGEEIRINLVVSMNARDPGPSAPPQTD